MIAFAILLIALGFGLVYAGFTGKSLIDVVSSAFR